MVPARQGAATSGTGAAPCLVRRASLRAVDLPSRALPRDSPRAAAAGVRAGPQRGLDDEGGSRRQANRTGRSSLRCGCAAPWRSPMVQRRVPDGAAVRARPEPSPPAELGGQPAAVRGWAGRGPRRLRRCGEAPGARAAALTAAPLRPRGRGEPPAPHTYSPGAGRKRPPGAAASWFPPPDKLRQVSGGLRGAPPAARLPLLR